MKYAPVGNTLSGRRLYGARDSRRRSARRCADSHIHNARSRNNRFTAPPRAVAESVVSGGIDVGAGIDGFNQ